MDDLLSSYQTSLLDMVFLGDIANRGKFNMIMADQIDPFMPGLEYMDRGDFENELKQVLGESAGSTSKRFEKVFISYFSLLCREMFLRSFFTPIFTRIQLSKHIRELIFRAKEDPHHLVTIRAKLNQATNDLILFTDTLGYLLESLEFVTNYIQASLQSAKAHSRADFRAKEDPHHLVTIRAKLNQATNDLILFTDTLGYLLESLEFVEIPQKSPNASEEEKSIFSYFDLKKQHHDILLRAHDLEKLVIGAKYEIVNLRQMAEVLNTSELEDIFKTVEGNTETLADSSLVVEQCGSSIELVQTAFAKLIIDMPLLSFVVNGWDSECIYALIRYKKKRATKWSMTGEQ
ncbi:Hypothetical protein PHPALM_5364 [Phytophthora palmivora]|uniref:Uncharacterized protein n=1 Tax=Phytophthora palmivora TaxID=4796 RepID=A0A2P4YHI6_9STRA|nr:Hypothetical protein PHPALM_5364 [Phytophthora palmivora]